MRRIRFAIVTAGALATALIGACKGPAGATGLQGPPGPQGNANVLTDTFTLTNSQWVWNSQYSFETSPGSYTEYFTRYHDVGDSALTAGLLATGMVLGFVNPDPISNTSQWAPLPYEFLDGSGNFTYNIAFETMVDSVRLHYFFNQLNSSATIPTLSSYTIPTYQFKIIAVSGVIAQSMTAAHVDLKDYSAVRRFLTRAKPSEAVTLTL